VGSLLLASTAPLPAQAKARYIGVKLQKTADTTLGIKLDKTDEDDGLLIESVDPGGLFAKWNDANPEKAIQAGDRIMKINSQTGKVQMANECKSRFKDLDIIVKRSKKKPPDALMYDGFEGDRGKDMNGRWSLFFGKTVNEREVYKKDGKEGYFLVMNDCGQWQIAKKPVGECSGFGLKDGEIWKVDGEPQPNVKFEVAKEDIIDPTKGLNLADVYTPQKGPM